MSARPSSPRHAPPPAPPPEVASPFSEYLVAREPRTRAKENRNMKPKRTRKVHVEIELSVPATPGHLEVLRSAAESLTCNAESISTSVDPDDPRITDTEFDIPWARQEDVVDRIMHTMKFDLENFRDISLWFPKTEAEERRDQRHLERA